MEKVHTIFTMGNMDAEKGVTYFHEPLQPPNRAVMEPYKHMYMGEYLDVLLDKSSLPPDYKSSSGKPEFHQSIRFADGRDMDFKSIPYWCDMFVTPPILLGWDFLGVSTSYTGLRYYYHAKQIITKKLDKGTCLVPHHAIGSPVQAKI